MCMLIRIGLFLCKSIAYIDTHRCVAEDSEEGILSQAKKYEALCGNSPLEAAGFARPISIILPLETAPPLAGPRPSPPGAVRAQASRQCTFAQLAGGIPSPRCRLRAESCLPIVFDLTPGATDFLKESFVPNFTK